MPLVDGMAKALYFDSKGIGELVLAALQAKRLVKLLGFFLLCA